MFYLQTGFADCIRQILRKAYPLHDKRLETVDTYKDAILEQLKNRKEILGVQVCLLSNLLLCKIVEILVL